MASEGDRRVSGPYLLVGPGISQSNPFQHLPGEARGAGVAAEAGGGVNALDPREAGGCTALQRRGEEVGGGQKSEAAVGGSSQCWVASSSCPFLLRALLRF